MKPLVSILIPCHNAEPWLAETLVSVLRQSWPYKEIIVIDDGSSDRSLAVAQLFQSLGVKVLQQPNRGASAARNLGLQAAQGDLIQYLDADDLLAHDKIERQVQLLAEHPGCVAAGEWARFYDHPVEATFKPQPLWQDLSPVEWLICAWEGYWMMHPAAWLLPRAIAEQAGGWNESLSLNDDGEYFCRVVLASQEVKFCWGAKTFYRSGNTGSLSGRKSLAAFRSALQSLELCTQHLLDYQDDTRTRSVCANQFQRLAYDTYLDFPALCQEAETWVQQLGGSNTFPSGGKVFQVLSQYLGWKFTKQLQKTLKPISKIKHRFTSVQPQSLVFEG